MSKKKLKDSSKKLDVQAELSESAAKYRMLFENSSLAIAEFDKNGVIINCNETASRLFNVPIKKIIGLRSLEFLENEKLKSAIKKGISGTAGAYEGPLKSLLSGEVREIKITMNPIKLKDGSFEGAIGIGEDITESKKTQNELWFLSEITGQISSSVIATDLNFEITWVNKFFEKLYGYSLDDVRGHKPDFLNVDPISKEIQDDIYQTVSAGKTWEGEALNKKKDGSTFLCEMDIFPLVDGKGDIFAYAGHQSDITERNSSEIALKESEEKFRGLAEKSPNMIFINKMGKLVYVNEKCVDVMGYTKEEFYSEDFSFFSLIAPESMQKVKKNLQKHKKGGEIPPYEYKVLTKNGKKLDAIHTTRLINFEGEPAILGIITDITERLQAEEKLRESEEKWRTLAETSNDYIISADLDGQVQYINRTLPGQTVEQVLGTHVFDYVPKKDIQKIKSCFERVLKTGTPDRYVTSAKASDGNIHYFEARVAPVKHSGKTIAFTISNSDITERKNAENELEKHRFHLEDLVKERTAELTNANEQLQMEITGHKTTEKALRESEERFRLLTEGSLVGVYIVKDDLFRYVNPALAKIFGYTPDELVDKFGPTDLTRLEDRPLVTEQIRRRLEGEMESTHYTFRGLRKDGKAIHCEVLGRRIEYQGAPAVIGTLLDISERRLAELEMKRRLMRFKLDDGKLYLVEEPKPTLSIEAFKELLEAGYRGLVISRTPMKEFSQSFDGNIEFHWLAERKVKGALPPKFSEIEGIVEKLDERSAILIDRLDYLHFKNGFKKTLSFVQSLRELAYLKQLTIILSMDSSTLSKRELRLLEKETSEIEPMHRELPKDLLDVLRFVYNHNLVGTKPTYTDVRLEMDASKPTVRKKIRQLISAGYLMDNKKGMYKVVELTDRGKSLFAR